MKSKELHQILNTLGYHLVRNSKHQIFSDGIRSVSVPHQKDINKILTKHILKSVGYSK